LERLETLFNALLSFVDVLISRMGRSSYFSELWWIQRGEIAGAHLSSYITLYIASLSFVDVHIFGTGGFNYISLSYGGSKRNGEYEIAYAHFFYY
jgi:hypothetical protein